MNVSVGSCETNALLPVWKKRERMAQTTMVLLVLIVATCSKYQDFFRGQGHT